MEFVWRTLLGAECLCVDKWEAEGLWHGFFGAQLNVESNPKVALSTLGSVPISLLHQVHGTNIQSISDNVSTATLCGDGWSGYTNSSEPWIAGIKTADCIPVMLWSRSDHFCTVMHCGRKGTIAGLLGVALDLFGRKGISLNAVEMAVGPGVSGACYEIGQDLARDLEQEAQSNSCIHLSCLQENTGRYYLDLKRMLVDQAITVGLKESQIVVSDICTVCSLNFNSYRRDAEAAGRQLSLLGSQDLRPG